MSQPVCQRSTWFGNLWFLFLLFIITGCNGTPSKPDVTPKIPSSTPTQSPSVTSTESPLPTPTTIAITRLIFYGDSALAVGQTGDGLQHEGFSFIDNLTNMLDSSNLLITANYGGRSAKWGYEHIDQAVLEQKPDVATLWWGLNDLGSCPGIFDLETNQLLKYKLDALANEHLRYLEKQIDTLLANGISVYIMTTFPVLNGQLPWSHFDENNKLVWEDNHWCKFNLALTELVEGQRELVTLYHNNGKPVHLVDVWQVYMDHPFEEKMYMDVVHPASRGVQLIADEWLRVYMASKAP